MHSFLFSAPNQVYIYQFYTNLINTNAMFGSKSPTEFHFDCARAQKKCRDIIIVGIWFWVP